MAQNFAADLDSHLEERRDQLFVATLVLEATKPNATTQRLQEIYSMRNEGQRSPNWRASAAADVRYFFFLRIAKTEVATDISGTRRPFPGTAPSQAQQPIRIRKKDYALAMGWSPRRMTNEVAAGHVPICRPAAKKAQNIVVDLMQVPPDKREAVQAMARLDT